MGRSSSFALCVLLAVLAAGCGDDPTKTDATPPAAVTDLALVATRDSSATVTWTAPGDDGDEGRAALYDLRYSLTPFPAGWDSATVVAGLAPPLQTGQAETVTVGGLAFQTTYWLALQAQDEAGNMSGLSNIVEAETGDTTPPGRIVDLRALSLELRAVRVAFTATGDDGDQGRATKYEVRHAASVITDDTWAEATAHPFGTIPRLPGDTETLWVTGLTPGETIHLAIRVTDDAGLMGPVSNDLQVTLPQDTFPPAAITDLTVANTGVFSADLTWTAPGDDSYEGRADHYEARFAGTAITKDSWSEAWSVACPDEPKMAGETEKITFSGLPGDQTVWLCVRAVDAAGNLAPVSNAASAFIPSETRAWIVRADGSGDAPTIQAGIDSSSHGDQVLVHPGTYYEHIDFKGRNIHVRSVEGAEETIIDGSGAEGSVVTFQSGETLDATIQGFTIQGGTGTYVEEGLYHNGGGILCRDGTGTILENIIQDNTAGVQGRGFGGGLLVVMGDSRTPPQSIVIHDNQFLRNSSGTNGGGVTLSTSFADLQGNWFEGNIARYDGGGIYIFMSKWGKADIVGNTFVENVAGDHGGGVEAGQMGYQSSPLLIEGNLFVRNEAHGEDLPSDSGTGGAISMRGWAGSIMNNTFVGNIGTGGAPCTGGALLVTTESLIVVVEGNIFATSTGCAVACRFGAEATQLRDNIFWGNSPSDADNPRSCFPWTPAQNLFTDPLFCDPANDDYRVRSDSPALAHPDGPIGAFPTPGCSAPRPSR